MSKTIQFRNTEPAGADMLAYMSGDTIQIGGSRYRLDTVDATRLLMWCEDRIRNADRKSTGCHEPDPLNTVVYNPNQSG